ncbi:hypothetical protein BDF22DRAFT_654652 [Syncephalis plumigaleata]|nr:hypothetical protein BDF22DRAFT_654652 [Syncephalis plumigaleata]
MPEQATATATSATAGAAAAVSSTGAQNAERLLLLLKSTRGASCVNLIQQVLSAPGVYVFAEFLEAANVQELAKDASHAAYVELLKIFSYGTFSDYFERQSTLPVLDSKQLSKLRQLTIVSLAAQRQTLPYYQLMQALHLSELHEMESLVIETIYGGILRGRLDQRANELHVDYAMGRDLSPGQLDTLAQTIDTWCDKIDHALHGLDERLALARDAAKGNVRLKQKHEEECEATKQAITAKFNSQRGRVAAGAGGAVGGKANEPRLERVPSAGYKRSSHK